MNKTDRIRKQERDRKRRQRAAKAEATAQRIETAAAEKRSAEAAAIAEKQAQMAAEQAARKCTVEACTAQVSVDLDGKNYCAEHGRPHLLTASPRPLKTQPGALAGTPDASRPTFRVLADTRPHPLAVTANCDFAACDNPARLPVEPIGGKRFCHVHHEWAKRQQHQVTRQLTQWEPPDPLPEYNQALAPFHAITNPEPIPVVGGQTVATWTNEGGLRTPDSQGRWMTERERLTEQIMEKQLERARRGL